MTGCVRYDRIFTIQSQQSNNFWEDFSQMILATMKEKCLFLKRSKHDNYKTSRNHWTMNSWWIFITSLLSLLLYVPQNRCPSLQNNKQSKQSFKLPLFTRPSTIIVPISPIYQGEFISSSITGQNMQAHKWFMPSSKR